MPAGAGPRPPNPAAQPPPGTRLGSGRRLVVAAAAVVAVAAVAYGWSGTLVGEYSVMDMGAPAAAHAGHAPGGPGAGGSGPGGAGAVDVITLTADPDRPADVRVRLVARAGRVDVAGGRPVDGYTVDGASPGPTIRARQGDLVEVELVNASVAGGTTLHWHGIDVPGAADGVAGVTQDAVPVGGRYVYRFVARDAGTFWYHSHQVSHEQVRRGLLGAVVVTPREPAHREDRPAADVLAVLHLYGGQHTVDGSVRDPHVAAAPGSAVRVRVVNTDQGTAAVWSDAPLRVVATDGRDVHAPTDVTGRTVLVPAGGRVDVTVRAPAEGAAGVHVGGARVVHVGAPGATAPRAPQPRESLDLLAYGAPAPLGFDPQAPDRRYDYAVGRRPGVVDGRPGLYWTVNGRMFPHVPAFEVDEGDVVRVHLANRTSAVHPMHLHGHHVVVLARDGVPASGSPWWVDSLDVRPGESYDVAFVADNPGIWMDHCHTLAHAVEGLVAHVMYRGVTTPFTVHGEAANQPE
ncbi:multicopper oxidase family protein [Puerhibacterium puerhi]|uniref:multicopper oxidase family protein n=1 Tax=Puerhibacterium puerhi TaxID=2692623 RepID=UPI0013587C50|nr:multicopper oxidase family protein [Puerhibacterium puerhi]